MTKDRETAILEVTESMIREGGYNSFSFRNIATEVGIKSSSVHYHFATKEDLGVAVTKRYTDQFLLSLGDPTQQMVNGENPIKKYISAFRHALVTDKAMCLCGILGSEVEILPEAVAEEAKIFFKRNIDWLTRAYATLGKQPDAGTKAVQILCTLQGALIAARVLDDIAIFDQAAAVFSE